MTARTMQTHRIRLSEKITGMIDTKARAFSRFRWLRRRTMAQPAITNGTRREKTPPQSLVYTNGARGRGTS